MMGKIYNKKSPYDDTSKNTEANEEMSREKRKCLSNYPPMIVKMRKSKYQQILTKAI